jgi:hypothetical protein
MRYAFLNRRTGSGSLCMDLRKNLQQGRALSRDYIEKDVEKTVE